MGLEEIEEYTGRIYNKFVQGRGVVIVAERGKFFLSKRSETLSDASAIERVSDYGIAKVLWIGKSDILQLFVDFDHIPLNLRELTELMKKIHSNKKNDLTLVHGDFSSHNTTIYHGEAKCFDYEHNHWGNPYIDIGRIVLRECLSEGDIKLLFDNYSGGIPPLEELRFGFIAFCKRQYEMRCEKNQVFQKVPKLRAERLLSSGSTLSEILCAFKDPVRL
jgi:hypothetical protein